MKKLLLLLILFCFTSFSFSKEFTNSEFQAALTEAQNGLKELLKNEVKNGKTTPIQNKDKVLFVLEELYRNGLINNSQYNNFLNNFLKLESSIDFVLLVPWNKFIDDKFTEFKSNRPACLAKNNLAVGGQCCGALEALPNKFFESKNPSCGKKSGEQCTQNEQCCSKLCSGIEKDKPGRCESVNSCFELVNYENECSEENPYCKQSAPNIKDNEQVACVGIDHNSSNTNQCISNTNSRQSCSSDDDCCSDKCVSGKCVPKSICMICTMENIEFSSDRECCPGLYKSEITKKCMRIIPMFIVPSFSKVEKPRNELKNIWNTISDFFIAKVHAQETNCSGQDCTVEGNSILSLEDEAEFSDRLRECTKIENEDLKTSCLERLNIDRNDKLKEVTTAQKTFKTISQKDFVKIFQVPAFTAREKSDIKKCEFNSFNDNWLAATPMEKNAQIVLLGFEVMLSGLGTNDKINFKIGDKTTNIFSSLREIMLELRNNRMDMYKILAKTDNELACQCMETFGVNSFSAEKIEAFRANCPNGNKIAELDGSKNENTKNQIADIDLGLKGISHEKLALDWQQKRMNAQLDFFLRNSTVEAKLEKFLQEFNKINWFESELVQTKVKQFDVNRLSLTGKIVGNILTGGLITVYSAIRVAFDDDYDWGDMFGDVYFEDTMEAAAFLQNAVQGTNVAFPKDVTTDVCGPEEGIFVKTKNCKRFVNWPYYEDTSGAKRCVVNQRKMYCISNQYIPSLDTSISSDNDAIAQFMNIGTTPLLDVWVPNFYPKDQANLFIQEMQITQKFNEAYSFGLQKFIDNDAKSPNQLMGFVAEGAKNAFSNMIDGNGRPVSQYIWNQEKIDELKKAIVTYAMCDKFSECGQMNIDEDKMDELVGFGHYFQNESDAIMFANYVYQMHFFWPKVANSNFKAYPPPGLYAYLDGVLSSIQILGSLNALNGINFAELFNVFEGDLNKRKGFYNAKGITANLGESSFNSKFSKGAIKGLKLINFSTGEGIEEFEKLINKEKSANTLTKADLELASAARSHALGLKRRVEKNQDITNALNKTARGKKTLSKLSNFSNKFNSPGDKIFQNSNANVASKIRNDAPSENTSKAYEFQIPKMGNISIPNNNSNNTYSNYDNQNISGVPSHGLSDNELKNILEKAKKDKSLYEVNEKDSLFSVVSKCYKRNLDLVLVSSKEIKQIEIEQKENKQENTKISKDKKDELKRLLGK